MSPATTATRDQNGDHSVPLQLPYPTTELLLSLSREIVVDWQLPSDPDRKN
jgi:hypothetical protein